MTLKGGARAAQGFGAWDMRLPNPRPGITMPTIDEGVEGRGSCTMFSPSEMEAVRVRSPEQVRACAENFRDLIGGHLDVRVCAVHDLATSRPMKDAEGHVLATDVFGWVEDGEQWWRLPQIAFHSPMAMACRYESEPFWCDASGFYSPGENPYLPQISIASWLETSYPSVGIVVPIHLPFGQIGVAMFVPNQPAAFPLEETFRTYKDSLAIASRAFIASYVNVISSPRRLPIPSELRKREIECLQWAAIGKTDAEIASLMSITHRTVRFHLVNAAHKLNAVNRSQTLFKATQLGYIKNTA